MNCKKLIVGSCIFVIAAILLIFEGFDEYGRRTDQRLAATPSAKGSRLFSFANVNGSQRSAQSSRPVATGEKSAPQLPGNLLETTNNLRDLYESFKDSDNAVGRNIAYRAWTACFPTYIGPEGRPVTVDSLLQGLPVYAENNELRHAAYRSLHQRCGGFASMSREEALRTTRQQQDSWSKGDSLAPGELATKYLRDGDVDRALMVARDVIASKDAYAASSLHDFINQFFVRQVDAQAEPSRERPDLRSLAFSIAACQIGLECGAESLTAIQLCANTGQCEGSVVDRYLQTLPDQADRDAALMESIRVAEAIQSGNLRALGL